MSEPHYLEDELYARVRRNSEIFEFLQNGSLDGLWYWDLLDPEQEWMNPGFWELLGYDPAEMRHLATEWQDLIHPDDLETSQVNLRQHLEDPSHPYDQIVRYRHRDGHTIWVRCRGIAIRDEEGRAIRMLGAHNDLTSLKQLEEELRRLASEDALTGMANRRSFDEHFQWTAANCERTGEIVSLVIVDLDHFKQVNDTHGHQVGDAILQACSQAITTGIRQNDFAARWGGDEFIALLHGAGVEASIEIAERVRALINEIGTIDGGVSASIGITTFTGQDIEAHPLLIDEQLSAADRALYDAKASGGDRVVHVASVAVA